MGGRTPMGPRLVEHLEGSPQARERLAVIMETLAGTLPIREACERLGIGEAMFHRVRMRVLQGAMADLEPRPRGRRPRNLSDAERICQELEAENKRLEAALHLANVRGEVAAILPRAVPSPVEDETLKKTTRRQRLRLRKRRPR